LAVAPVEPLIAEEVAVDERLSCNAAWLGIQFGAAMPEKVQCFVAYSSEPASRAEPIELAIEEISNGGVVRMTGWKSVSVGGRIVIGAICDEIRKAICLWRM
jgi:hypothetical protein